MILKINVLINVNVQFFKKKIIINYLFNFYLNIKKGKIIKILYLYLFDYYFV